jgi:hypothetical protein
MGRSLLQVIVILQKLHVREVVDMESIGMSVENLEFATSQIIQMFSIVLRIRLV